MQIKGMLFLTLFLLAAAVAGCGESTGLSADNATATALAMIKVDSVHIIRTSDSSPGKLPAFDHIGKDAKKVQALYTGLILLPRYSAQGVSCPTDNGVQYQLTFMNGGAVVFHAIADPSGCQIAVLDGNDNRSAVNSNLWMLIANAVGVTPSTVYPISSQ
jgi:hypothetical protein